MTVRARTLSQVQSDPARPGRDRAGDAGRFITSWSHPGRVRSEAAFTKLGGVAPIDASLGTMVRHRLNAAVTDR
jgi:transposase